MAQNISFLNGQTEKPVNEVESSVLILAGEASGDYHAAALVRDVRSHFPGINFTGIGGEKLEAAGMKLLIHYSQINTIGFSGGFSKLRRILTAYNLMKSELRSGKYDVFIPVDFPDVNIRLCKIAQKAGVRICYYISPQVWAWRWRRIYKIAAVVDRMMTIFPFEEKLYSDVGVRAYFVGHTMVRDIPQNMDKHKLRSELGIRNQNYLVTLAPGSRRSEITRVLPIMCEAARSHLTHCPDTEFVVPLASSHLKELIENILRESQLEAKIVMGEASRTMGASDYGLVTSGTATLQAALAKMPHAVVYIIDKFSWFLATKILMPLVMDPNIHVAIANMLCIKNPSESENPIDIMIERGYRITCLGCGRPLLVPELLQNHATTENLAEWLDRFKSDPNLRIAMEAAFSKLREVLEPHASNPSPSAILIELITEKHREISLLNS